MRPWTMSVGLALVAALTVGPLAGCAAPPEEQPSMAAAGDVGSMSLGSLAQLPLPEAEGSDAEDSLYTNATYGFTFDPSFCDDLVLVDEARDAAVFESESWGMRLFAQGTENVEHYDAQSLADAIALQAEVADGDPVVGEGYCVVQQLERDFETGERMVVIYTLFVGSGNYQGVVCEFDPDTYETITQEQGAELVAAFLPGDLAAVHEELRQDDEA